MFQILNYAMFGFNVWHGHTYKIFLVLQLQL